MDNDRVIKLSGAKNFRDVGGLSTTDGFTLRRSQIYRSDELSGLSKGDVEVLHSLNLKTALDLRTPQERHSKPDHLSGKTGMKVISIPIYPEEENTGRFARLRWILTGKFNKLNFTEFTQQFYHRIAFEHTVEIGAIISLLSDRANLPAVFHCTAGKDRTGFVAAIIQLFAGASQADVIEDYLITNELLSRDRDRILSYLRWLTFFQVSKERMLPLMEARAEYLNGVLDALLDKYSSVKNYLLHACGIGESALHSLRAALVG